MTSGSLSLLAAGLDGWRMAGSGGFHDLGGGVVESFGGSGLLWYADAVFEDFVLEVEWRITRFDDNSGVFIRTPPLDDDDLTPAIERGYEVQIDDRGVDPQRRVTGSQLHLTGAIYKLAPAIRCNARAVGEWNAFRISADSREIAVTLNGEPVSRLTHLTRERRGHVALQNHHAGSAVQFRNLVVTSSTLP